MILKTKRSIRWVRLRKKKYAGIHLIAEFWGAKEIESTAETKKILIGAANNSGSYPLKVSTFKFNPRGITGVVLLAESHISIHSWPEYNYLAIDIFTCGDKAKPLKALEYLKEQYNPKKIELKEIIRGVVHNKK